MNLRPDEAASLSQIERSKKSDALIKKGAGTLLGAGTAALGVGLASKALPFLSEFIPADLALKGINKIAPEIGKFLKKGQSMGLNLKEGLDFLRNNLQPQQEENPVIKQAKDFETNYPDVVQALQNQINNGRSPQEAAAILKISKPLEKKINQIEKDTGKNFVDFILEIMGGNQSSQMQQPQQMQQQAPQGTQSQQQQGGGIDPQLAQLMQGIRQSISQLRGSP